MKTRIFTIFILFLQSSLLFSGEWFLENTGSSVSLPEGWVLYNKDEEGRISFINPEENVIFQVSVYPGDTYNSDLVMMDDHLSALTVLDEDLSRFYYQDLPCSLADLSIQSGDNKIRGWFLFINREDYDYYLTVITNPVEYEKNLPLILSCLDGFSADDEGRLEPGVVSVFISEGNPDRQENHLTFNDESIPFQWTVGRSESLRLLIEREASILTTYNDPDIFDAAWKRYYQLIYRDGANDLAGFSAEINKRLAGMSNSEKAEVLLSWLQDFNYGSTDQFSDLLTPIESLISHTGDCDSLALVYSIMLNQMEIPSLLMVSREYSHALAAVAVEKKGAHFLFDDKTFVVAEMTKKVELGQISSEMSDLNKWVIIPFTDNVKGILPFTNSKK